MGAFSCFNHCMIFTDIDNKIPQNSYVRIISRVNIITQSVHYGTIYDIAKLKCQMARISSYSHILWLSFSLEVRIGQVHVQMLFITKFMEFRLSYMVVDLWDASYAVIICCFYIMFTS